MEVIEVDVFELEAEIIQRETLIKKYDAGLIAMWIDQGKALINLHHKLNGSFAELIEDPTNTVMVEVCGAERLEKHLNKALARGTIYRYMAFAYSPKLRETPLDQLIGFDQRSLEKMVFLEDKAWDEVIELGSYKDFLQLSKEREKIDAIEHAKTLDLRYDIVNGDSTVETLNAPTGIKCVITDPPYGMAFVSNRREASAKDVGIANDEDIYTAIKVTTDVFNNLYRKMQKNSSLFCFIGWREEPMFRELIESCGFTIKNSIIWVKNNHGTGDLKGTFAPKHERIIFATKGTVELSHRHTDVLEGSDTRTDHPTAKPVDLIKLLIEDTTLAGDLVVDPFAGHGSTLIAGKELSRNIWGCELDPYNYAEIKRHLDA